MSQLKKPEERIKQQRAGGDPGIKMYSSVELLASIRKLKLQNQALICFLYLTGCRISEVLGNKSSKYPTEPLKCFQFEFKTHKGKDLMIVHNIPVLKRRGSILRSVPVYIAREKEFVRILVEYLKTKNVDDPVFTMSRQHAWYLINKKIGLWCHYFRHLRNTRLCKDYGLAGHELQKMNGWSSSRPSDTYVHLNWRDVADKMIQD